MAPAPADRLPAVSSALAVVAHPDDESFGLGALLSALVDAGVNVTAICFTHGEASTLGADGAELHQARAAELADAARALGLGRVELLGHPEASLPTSRSPSCRTRWYRPPAATSPSWW